MAGPDGTLQNEQSIFNDWKCYVLSLFVLVCVKVSSTCLIFIIMLFILKSERKNKLAVLDFEFLYYKPAMWTSFHFLQGWILMLVFTNHFLWWEVIF